MSQSFGASLGPANAGQLAQVSARFVNPDGTFNGSAITSTTGGGTTLTESGNGFYLLLATPPITQGALRWFVNGVVVAEEAINPDPRLANLDVAVSTRADGAQWTTARAGKIDNLDAAVSTRLATAGYTIPPTTAQIKAAVLDELVANHLTSGSIGEALSRIDVAVSTRLATSGYTAPPNVTAIVVGILDQLLSGHNTSGTVGEALTRIGTLPTADQDRVALLDGTLAGHSGAGTLGALLANLAHLDADVSGLRDPDLSQARIDVIRGNSYLISGGTQKILSSPDFPPLTQASTVIFVAVLGPADLRVPVTVHDEQTSYLELTHSQTLALQAAHYSAHLEWTNVSQATDVRVIGRYLLAVTDP